MKDGHKQQLKINQGESDGLASDEIGLRLNFRENCKSPGFLAFSVSRQ